MIQEACGRHDDLLFTLDEYLEKIGINVAAFHAECGSGELEWSMEPTWGIDTADKYLMFKGAVKDLCRMKGYECLFTTVPYMDASAVFTNFNHSLWDDKGNNAFFDKSFRN